jgi:ABC-type transporter Mla subunit MlaD
MFDYFTPDNPLARFIVLLLWGLFVLWLLVLLRNLLVLSEARRVAERLNTLLPSLKELRLRRHEAGRLETPEEQAPPADEFAGVVRGAALDPRHPLCRHLQTIFVAGCEESRLEVGELLRHTERELLRGDSFRRNLLSVFLIIGLLGTLFGIADSIISLLRLMAKERGDIVTSLSALLAGLRGAFAPSISGVLASILGTLVYSAHQWSAIAPLLSKVRAYTLNDWIPALYPTTGQMAAEAAQHSLQAAKQVADFARSIESDTGRLQAAITSAARLTESYDTAMKGLCAALGSSASVLQESMKALGDHLTRFSQAADRWAPFEEKITDFYEAVAKAQTRLTEQSQGFSVVLDRLDTVVGRLPEPFERASEQVTKVSDDFAGSVDELSTKLAAEMKTHFESIRRAHGEELEKVKEMFVDLGQRLDALGVPFRDAAEEMRGQAEIIRRNADGSVQAIENKLGDQATATEKVSASIRELLEYMKDGAAGTNGDSANGAQLLEAILDKLEQVRIGGSGLLEGQRTQTEALRQTAAEIHRLARRAAGPHDPPTAARAAAGGVHWE